MKKLFLLIPAFLLSIAINADVISITPTSPHSSNNLRQAIAAANSGDIVEMATGTYVETGDWIAFDDKEVIVRAAEGAEVIIKPQFSVRVKAGDVNQIGKAEFRGVKFDCSTLESSELFVPSDNNANQSVVLKNCELYDWSLNKALIHSTSSRKLDVIDIDNCYFHGFEKSIVFVENASLVSLNITNSTFANVSGNTTEYYAAPIYVKATTGSVLVDHCTFYDVMPMSLSYGVVTVDAISDVLVSNCIFARSTSADMCTSNLPTGSNVKNCLTFNYDNWQPYGHYTTATVTDCVKANPLFKDAANGDFSLYASSPARGVGLDGSNLGDPRRAPALTPVAIPATLVPFDALLSEKSSIIQSTPDSIFLKTESTTIIEWAKWNVSVEEDGLYDFTAYAKRTGSTGSQKLQIDVLNSTETEILKSKAETGLPNECTISTGAVNLIAGNTYIIKVYNNYDWAKSKLIKVEATYAGGKTITIPDTLRAIDALKSERAYVNEAGELRFTDDSHAGYIHDQWAKWNISAAKAGKYKFTANVNSSNGQNYRITLKNEDESSTIGTWYGENNDSGERKIATELVDLTIGNYVLMIEDTVNYSHGRIVNIVASYEGGAVANAPGLILAADALIKAEIGKSTKMIHQENGDIEYKANVSQLDEYAIWNIHATEAGEMVVTIHATGENGGHEYTLELYEGNTLKGSAVEDAETKWNKTDFDFTNHLIIPAAGDYTLKLTNNVQYSITILHGITFTPYVAPAAVTIDENATDNSSWIDYKDGAPVNVQFIRTLTAGMYNTFCAPFAISSSLCKAVFGSDVEIYTLKEATVEGDILNVELKSETSIYQGTPVFIKPSADVVNPSFEGVSIVKETPAATTKTNANLVGTFIKTELEANPDILFLGPNNTLYFPEQTTPIKGMRAWFVVHDVPGGSHMIRHARIVQNEQVVTAIELVNQKPIDTIKVVETGQIIIVRDGLRYNTLGARVK